LRKTAYPILKEICEYWEDNLKKMPDGTLMVPNGWSPEHGPREDGIMHDQQLVWELFQDYLEAAKALSIDMEYQKKVEEMLAHLAPNKIGKWGQLQEWQTDRDDPNDQHRHTSHLFAVYPGHQISMTKTPELAKAAIISLRSRSGNYGTNENTPFTVESTVGDSRRSWTWPWRCALWARLGEGEKAGIMIRGLLKFNTLPNLFCSHPPFQMDGNFGITGAMAEMLIQSHAGEIQLLPAIPKAWAPKGSFTGLCARGGYIVNCSWENGKVTNYKIISSKSSKVKVRVNGALKETSTVKE
jgi:alpha-L-fucosidase 2